MAWALWRSRLSWLASRNATVSVIGLLLAKFARVTMMGRREVGKCEGRKSHAELNPALVALAKRLHRQKPKGGRLLREISAELEAQGYLNENGRPFAAASVKSMLD
jgi:hypothetical protein